jgi:5-methylcytosine-specific restriction endonuclease McrA
MRLCSGAGCGRKIEEGVRFCDECKVERGTPVQADAIGQHTTGYDAELDKLRKSGRWQRVRERAIKKDPMCKRCGASFSEIIDHIVPAAVAILQAQESKRWPYDPHAGYFLMCNLQGLCRSCHGLKTTEDKTHVGPWPSVVEAFDAAPKKVWTF